MHPFFAWCYGSGLPKAHNAGKAINREIGADPTALTDWDGWGYGTQSMKPAIEPIYVGQKPFSEKNGAQNLLKHGVGAMNIADNRVNGQRHPANLLHDGSEDVVAMFPVTTSGTGAVKRKSAAENEGNTGSAYGAESRPEGTEMVCYGDTGSASRFFNCFPPDSKPLFYHSKANRADRSGSKHPAVKPVRLMQWLVRLVTPPGGTVLDPFGGSGTTAAAALAEGFDCILMEAEEQFIADIRRRFNLPSADLSDDLNTMLGNPPYTDIMDLVG